MRQEHLRKVLVAWMFHLNFVFGDIRDHIYWLHLIVGGEKRGSV